MRQKNANIFSKIFALFPNVLLPERFYFATARICIGKKPQICRISVISGKKSTGNFTESHCRGDNNRAAARVCGSPVCNFSVKPLRSSRFWHIMKASFWKKRSGGHGCVIPFASRTAAPFGLLPAAPCPGEWYPHPRPRQCVRGTGGSPAGRYPESYLDHGRQ